MNFECRPICAVQRVLLQFLSSSSEGMSQVLAYAGEFQFFFRKSFYAFDFL